MIWRPTPDRMPAFNQAMQFWSMVGKVRFFDSGHTPFNRAASRNLAVRAAEQDGACRLVITDADTIPEFDPLKRAWDAADDSAVRLPYDRCRVLDRAGMVLGEFGFTCGGVYVTTPNAWWAIGGQDERFDKWGPEDMAFSLAHRTLTGQDLARHNGVLYSLAHDRDTNAHTDSEADPIVALYRRYEHANGDVDLMRELCFPS